MKVTIDALRGELRSVSPGCWEVRTFVLLTYGDHPPEEWHTGADEESRMTDEASRGYLTNNMLCTLESILFDLSVDERDPLVPPVLTATWAGTDPAARRQLATEGLAEAIEIEVPTWVLTSPDEPHEPPPTSTT